jgi:hypothetical protein
MGGIFISLNIEQEILNKEFRSWRSVFNIPCSLFNISIVATTSSAHPASERE